MLRDFTLQSNLPQVKSGPAVVCGAVALYYVRGDVDSPAENTNEEAQSSHVYYSAT